MGVCKRRNTDIWPCKTGHEYKGQLALNQRLR
jgi:hypothetical protein